jgi:hypothetical protein
MAFALRLLLALCLIAPAMPGAGARLVAATDGAIAEHAMPPCHDPTPAPDAPPVSTHADCCGGPGTDCGCGCMHAAGLPPTLAALAGPVPDAEPPPVIPRASPPPPSTRAERPPIA